MLTHLLTLCCESQATWMTSINGSSNSSEYAHMVMEWSRHGLTRLMHVLPRDVKDAWSWVFDCSGMVFSNKSDPCLAGSRLLLAVFPSDTGNSIRARARLFSMQHLRGWHQQQRLGTGNWNEATEQEKCFVSCPYFKLVKFCQRNT